MRQIAPAPSLTCAARVIAGSYPAPSVNGATISDGARFGWDDEMDRRPIQEHLYALRPSKRVYTHRINSFRMVRPPSTEACQRTTVVILVLDSLRQD